MKKHILVAMMIVGLTADLATACCNSRSSVSSSAVVSNSQQVAVLPRRRSRQVSTTKTITRQSRIGARRAVIVAQPAVVQPAVVASEVVTTAPVTTQTVRTITEAPVTRNVIVDRQIVETPMVIQEEVTQFDLGGAAAVAHSETFGAVAHAEIGTQALVVPGDFLLLEQGVRQPVFGGRTKTKAVTRTRN